MPVTSPSAKTQWQAVVIGMPAHAPAAKDVAAGNVTACSAGKATYSAHEPKARPHCAFQSQTRSPIRLASTPWPTASISPAPSECGTIPWEGHFRRDAARPVPGPQLHIRRIDARRADVNQNFAG
ncbi:MAG: hypothetical protein AAGC62_07720, partial [Pseudomonadota bacterium]